MEKRILTEFDIFSDISQDTIAAITEKCTILEFGENDIIFHQDELAQTFFGVVEGEVELDLVYKEKVLKSQIIDYEKAIVSKYEIQERPIVTDIIGQGDVFGWSAFFTDGLWTSTARCSKQTKLFSLPVSDLMAMFEKDNNLGYVFMTKLAGIIVDRLHHRTDKLVEVWGEAFETHKI
ncbi:MAG: cyclic nucleotide-binding domain-containing protein [Deltaproteobacteria bacterium]|nr:cyclic nucleotide-binding domain-containing protein [Deltaproteobacteria bacterium]